MMSFKGNIVKGPHQWKFFLNIFFSSLYGQFIVSRIFCENFKAASYTLRMAAW